MERKDERVREDKNEISMEKFAVVLRNEKCVREEKDLTLFSSSPLFLISSRSLDSPSNQILRFWTKMNIIWEDQSLSPSQDLSISVMSVLRAERWITTKTFEHDSTQRPPITFVSISLLKEDFRSNVIWSTNCRICLSIRREKD